MLNTLLIEYIHRLQNITLIKAKITIKYKKIQYIIRQTKKVKNIILSSAEFLTVSNQFEVGVKHIVTKDI